MESAIQIMLEFRFTYTYLFVVPRIMKITKPRQKPAKLQKASIYPGSEEVQLFI